VFETLLEAAYQKVTTWTTAAHISSCQNTTLSCCNAATANNQLLQQSPFRDILHPSIQTVSTVLLLAHSWLVFCQIHTAVTRKLHTTPQNCSYSRIDTYNDHLKTQPGLQVQEIPVKVSQHLHFSHSPSVSFW